MKDSKEQKNSPKENQEKVNKSVPINNANGSVSVKYLPSLASYIHC